MTPCPGGGAGGYLSCERTGSREGWSTGRSARIPRSPREGRGHCGRAGRDAVRRQEEESRRGDGEADWGEGEQVAWEDSGVIRSNIGEGNPEGGRSRSCSGGAQKESSKGGKKGEAAEPQAPVAPRDSSPGGAECCLLLLSSAPRRAPGRGGEGCSEVRENSLRSLWLLLPSLITHPSPRPSRAPTPWPSTKPIPLPDPQASGIPDWLLPSSHAVSGLAYPL